MTNNKQEVTAKDISQESDKIKKEQLYNQYVSQMTPKHNWFLNLCKAYLVGGVICTVGQGFTNFFLSKNIQKEMAASYTIISLILIAVILTGLSWYQKLAKFAGAGTIVPITGFANSIASTAIEFKREGQVFGIGSKIFTIAGPVILYGIFSSWILGIIYMLINKNF